MPTANQCKQFAERVVNGDEKDSTAAIRNRFERLYRDWFPPEPEGPNRERYVRLMLDIWNMPQMIAHQRWCKDSVEHEQDSAQNFFGWRVAQLRDMLRFIWRADRETARYRVRMLAAETLEFNHKQDRDRIPPWKERQFAVCDWLERWLSGRKGSRLLVCRNPECDETKYFVRDAKEPNQKYCCPPCAVRAEELRRLERGKQRQSVRVSPRGRAAIVEAQKRRRRRERMEAGKRAQQGKPHQNVT